MEELLEFLLHLSIEIPITNTLTEIPDAGSWVCWQNQRVAWGS